MDFASRFSLSTAFWVLRGTDCLPVRCLLGVRTMVPSEVELDRTDCTGGRICQGAHLRHGRLA